jgi:hypothetical protein
VRELDAPEVEALLDAQQAPVDQQRQRPRRGAGLVQAAEEALLGHVLAEAGAREQVILDDAAHAGRLVGECTLVEVAEDARVRAGQQVQGDLASPLLEARIVELAADEAQ